MDPMFGHRREFLALAILFGIAPILVRSRQSHEQNIANQNKTCNQYEVLKTESSKHPS
eukprot:NODE_8463_length_408_cov_53.623955_g7588_i0.p1 GENE.NODE_8463_length_408_cov_53.623955_g7588_i0~~NODE_8463_length_408_cov_53.623955_g7588_i0.p1  ORF type:complete len:58 (-),score=0.91 NODE_8463_length_408_cov_53.623955_g7588_i0:33-206(-)